MRPAGTGSRVVSAAVFAVAVAVSAPALTQEPASPQPDPGQGTLRSEGPDLTAGLELVAAFVERQGIPGAAFVLSKGQSVLEARGFGEAREGLAATPETLFRVASLSKPMTAVAVVRLAERGRIDLDQGVLALLAEHPERGGREHLDPRFVDVTVRHLLQHRGGWDRSLSGDPMFEPLEVRRALGKGGPLAPTDVLQRMLYRPLDFEPGVRFAYSNFGYCMLGRVLEVATGNDYPEAMRELVFGPLGIESARLGATRPEGCGPREACYHDPELVECAWDHSRGMVPAPYGSFSIELLDAGAGWVMSARDLARFATAWTDLVSRESAQDMLAPPPGAGRARWYGMGWTVRVRGSARVWEHGGSLPGTYARMVCRDDGVSWVFVCNTRCDREGRRLVEGFDSELHAWLDRQPWLGAAGG